MRTMWDEMKEEVIAEVRAESVLKVLALRGMPVSEPLRQRILACTDVALLDQWLERALGATHVSDVLRDN